MPVADKLTYSVVDNKLTIDTIQTNAIEGDITLNGILSVDQSLSVRKDSSFHNNVNVDTNLTVGGEIRASTIYVDHLVSKTERQLKEPVSWAVDEGGIEGKGLVWKRDKKTVDIFIYKSDPSRIFTNLDIDFYKGSSIRIDGTPVLFGDTLGPSISKSNLRKVGRLKDLAVDGDVEIGEHIFFDSTSGRIGFGTDHANAAISLVDNGVEIILGSHDENLGNIGTFTSHDLGIITDNTLRMKITRSGKIIFGDSKSSNADLTVNGKLFVKELIVENHQERQSPLEFKAVGTSNYGKGMIFTGEGITKQFVFASMPDQFFSTEHINLAEGKDYHIGNKSILSENELGRSVTKSYLTQVGTLSNLLVVGNANFNDLLKITTDKIFLGNMEVSTKNGVIFEGSSFEFRSTDQSISLTNNTVSLGRKDSPVVHTIINGKMSIGLQTVRENAQLDVAGNIRFSDKLFSVGSKAPSTGSYRKGDIVWNDDPKETGYVGWVCIRDGNPGIWRGFGQIGVE